MERGKRHFRRWRRAGRGNRGAVTVLLLLLPTERPGRRLMHFVPPDRP